MPPESAASPNPPEPEKSPVPSEPEKKAAGPNGELPPGSERNFRIDLGEGFDEAIAKLRERAAHYYQKSQHTQVRIRFRGREVATVPLSMMLAVEAATFWWAGPLRMLVANALGGAFLEVEFINDADKIVEAGKKCLLEGELDDAMARFREAIVMDRDHAGAHLNLGVALKMKGNSDEAKAEFEKAVVLDPSGESGREARRQIEKLKK